jgi:uncharacterized protein YxeA
MKRLLVLLLSVFILFSVSLSETHAKSSARVRGYTKKSGTYVAPHRRTNPDKTKFNNYNTKGNFNPYTGKKGTKNPYNK